MENTSSTKPVQHPETLKEGTVLIPYPCYAHMFTKGAEYVVTKDDVNKHATIGEYWTIKTTTP